MLQDTRFTFASSKRGDICVRLCVCVFLKKNQKYRYERKTEFRRLSEILRIHFSNITRYPQQLEALVQSDESLPLRLQVSFFFFFPFFDVLV
jgi:hypothetical protein